MGSQSDLRFPSLPYTTVVSTRIWEVLIDLRVKLIPVKNLWYYRLPNESADTQKQNHL